MTPIALFRQAHTPNNETKLLQLTDDKLLLPGFTTPSSFKTAAAVIKSCLLL